MPKIGLLYLFNLQIESILESCHITWHNHFWPCPPAFNFCEFISCKKSVYPSVQSSDRVNFRVMSHYWPQPFLTMPTPNIFNHFLIFCMNLYQNAKNQLIPSVHSGETWETTNIRVHRPDWPNPFLTMLNQKNFNQLLSFVNLYQHIKMRLFHLFVLEKQLI